MQIYKKLPKLQILLSFSLSCPTKSGIPGDSLPQAAGGQEEIGAIAAGAAMDYKLLILDQTDGVTVVTEVAVGREDIATIEAQAVGVVCIVTRT